MFEPEVRAASRLKINGGVKRGEAARIHAQVPSWRDPLHDKQFDRSTAPAGTAHTHTPVLIPIPSQQNVPARQLLRETVALHGVEVSSRHQACFRATPPQWRLHAARSLVEEPEKAFPVAVQGSLDQGAGWVRTGRRSQA